MSYFKELNDLFENRAVIMINKSLKKENAKRNNLDNNDIDISINNKLYIDIQYSFNFKKFGDIRIDVLSAFYFKINNNIKESENLIKNSKENNFYNDINNFFFVSKYGKYIDSKKCDGILYFFYNKQKPLKENKPDIEKIKQEKISFMCFIPTKIIKKEIEENWFNVKCNFKINDKIKNNIEENHESAFVYFNLKNLCKKYNIKIYYSKDEFYLNFRNELEALYNLNKKQKR